MPGSHSEISVDEEGAERNDKSSSSNNKKKTKNGKAHGRSVGLVVPSVSKPRKPLSFTIGRKLISPKLSSSSSSSSSRRKGGCFCITRPPNAKNSSSPASDPNDENFTHEMLSVLLETNDFSSKECNPHL